MNSHVGLKDTEQEEAEPAAPGPASARRRAWETQLPASCILSVVGSVSATLARSAFLPGPVFFIAGKMSWLKPSLKFPGGLQFWDPKD